MRLLPPRNAPRDPFVLSNGTLIRPGADGSVVAHELDVDLLLTRGWQLDSERKKAARITDTLIRKAADARARHVDGADAVQRLEFGEVDAGERHGRVQVSHDQGVDTVSVHCVSFELSNVDAGLRSSFRLASAAFVNAGTDSAEQTDAKALIGIVIAAVLERHDFVGARVRERKLDQRYRAV